MKECSCGARITFAVSPTQRLIPLVLLGDRDPTQFRTAGFYELVNGQAVPLTHAGVSDCRDAGVPVYLSHFVDCPDRDRFSRKGQGDLFPKPRRVGP